MEIFMEFVLPVLLILVLAVLIGFGLSFLGEKIAISHDPKVDDVSRFLAGINCGGCGYAGCHAFAVALVNGETRLEKCNPTSSANKKNIADILGKDSADLKETVAIVHCNGGNKCKNKYSYQGFGDCQSAELLAGGNKSCYVGCIGFGTCNEYCKYEAVSVDKDTGVAVVNKHKCTSCGACVSACPKKIISRIPKTAKIFIACSNTNRGQAVRAICENGCIACGLCEKKCPHGAITLSNNLALINYDKCTGCRICVEVCPVKCIHDYN